MSAIADGLKILIDLDLGADSKVYGFPWTRPSRCSPSGSVCDLTRCATTTALGCLRPTGRSAAGYSLYDETAAERLDFIRGAQRMGVRLSDVKELLEVRDRGQCPCGHARVLVQRRLAEVSAEIRQLSAVRRQLVELQKPNEECIEVAPEEWSCCNGVPEGR